MLTITHCTQAVYVRALDEVTVAAFSVRVQKVQNGRRIGGLHNMSATLCSTVKNPNVTRGAGQCICWK